MGRKVWAIFVILQILGVSMALYSSRFQVGVGGVREFLWIPTTLVLLPGILFGYVADALDVGIRLSYWHAAPFFAVVVLLNVASWNVVVRLIEKRQRRLAP
jgi:hypothetical protein